MSNKKQERITIRKKMLDANVRVTQLATQLGHDHSVISKAINHGKFPRVLKKIKSALLA